MDAALAKRPKSAGAAQAIYLDPLWRVLDAAEAGEKAGDSSSPSSAPLLALALERTARRKILAKAGVTPQSLNAAINALRNGRTADPRRPKTPTTR